MPRLPVISGIRLVRILETIGYYLDHTAGSYMILVHPSRFRLSVPNHRELRRGLLRALIKDAGSTREEFMRLLD